MTTNAPLGARFFGPLTLLSASVLFLGLADLGRAQSKKTAPSALPTKPAAGPAAPEVGKITAEQANERRKKLYFGSDGPRLDIVFPDPAAVVVDTGKGKKTGGFEWSKLATAATLEKEVERNVAANGEHLASASVFTSKGYKKIKDNHTMLAVWLNVLSEFDGPSKMKDSAAAVRDLAATVPLALAASEDVKPDEAMFGKSKEANEAAAKLLKGEKVNGAAKARPWREVAVYTSVMKRMEAAQDARIRGWTANTEEFNKNLPELEHEAQLLAIMCEVILDKGTNDNAGNEDYQGWGKKLEQGCIELVAAVKAKDHAKAQVIAAGIAKQCADCHSGYR